MRKLTLQFGGIKEMLTKEQMKKINGGDYSCGYTSANGSTTFGSYTCHSDTNPCDCQDIYDNYCSYNNNCSDIDCGCKN